MLRIEASEAVPPGEVWLVQDGTVCGRVYNIGIDRAAEPQLKIGDWPWPEPKKGKQ